LENWAKVFSLALKKKYNFHLCGYKKRYDNKFFSPLSFVAVFGSGMGKNQDPGSGSGIRDKHPGSATLISPMDYAIWWEEQQVKMKEER
jgi:hypothetical protein